MENLKVTWIPYEIYITGGLQNNDNNELLIIKRQFGLHCIVGFPKGDTKV